MLKKKANHNFKNVAHIPKRAKRLHVLSLTALLILATHGIMALYPFIVPGPVAAEVDQNQMEKVLKDPNLPWQLEADEIRYDQTTDEYVAEGNVLIYKGNIKLLADYVRFDHKNMKAYAQGDVILTNGEDILSGTSMEIDLQDQVGAVENGNLFLKQNNYHLSGNLIKKVGIKTYTIDEATITTCDGEKPDWKLTGKKVKIKSDGEGTARHATLWARNMPVLYTPYFYYPARKDRQTGFLLPEGGISDRWGYYYNQPFFWAIDDSSDATFYGNYLSSRGLKGGLEYRYYLDDWSKGTLMVDGFVDRQIDDGIGDATEKWGFPDGDRDILRQNRDRYWLRGSHLQKMPWDIRARLDIDLVSDQDYTRDFKNGYMGWGESKKYFEDVFGRDLDDFNNPIRTNSLNFNKIWPNYSLNTQLSYFLDSTVRNTHDPDVTLQQLPLITFDAVKQKIAKSPFFYNLDSEYLYYWSRDGQRTQRMDVFPRLYLPFQIRPFISIEPSVGVRETLWYLDEKEFGPEDDKNFYHRDLFDTRLDLFSEVFRVFRVEGNTLDSIRHAVRPQIIYEFIPNVDQDDLPDFDSIDRIEKKNLVTYSLTNTFTSKTRKTGTFELSRRIDQTQAAVIDAPTDYGYNDFLRFKLEQSYNINVSTRKDPDQPLSPIFAELELFPGKYLALDTDALWSVYDGKFLSYNIATNLWDNRGDRLSVAYRRTKDSDEIDLNPVKSIYTGLQLKVTDSLALNADYEYNFLANTLVETGIGILYKAQCWSFDGRVNKTPDNLNFEFKINLFGLGEFGI